MKNLISALIFLLTNSVVAQDTLSVVYPNSIASIFSNPPTEFPTCKGVTMVTVPGSDSITISEVIVSYDMSSTNGGKANMQRSKIYFANNNTSEPNWAVAPMDVGFNASYNRSTSIANGSYASGEELVFEIWPQRMAEIIPGCNTDVIQVDGGSWTLDIVYSPIIQATDKVGINTVVPEAMFHVNGKMKIGDDTDEAVEGMIRYNNDTQDFEGYNGIEWLSLSNGPGEGEGGNNSNTSLTDSLLWGLTTQCENEIFSFTTGQGYTDLIDYVPSIGTSIDHDNGWLVQSKKEYIGSTQATTSLIFYSSDNQQSLSISNTKDLAIDFPYCVNGSSSIVEVFQFASDTWIPMQTISIPGGATNTGFGSALDIEGDFLAIGAYKADSDGLSQNGLVYIYKRTGGTWNFISSLKASDQTSNSQFGSCIDFGDNYLIVGAQNKTQSNGSVGGAYIFERVGDQFTEVEIIDPAGLSSDHKVGSLYTASITNEHAAVIASNSGPNDKTFIYYNDNGSWNQSQVLDTVISPLIWIDEKLDLDANTLVVGDLVYNIVDGNVTINSRLRNCNTFNNPGLNNYVIGDSSIFTHQGQISTSTSSISGTFYIVRFDKLE